MVHTYFSHINNECFYQEYSNPKYYLCTEAAQESAFAVLDNTYDSINNNCIFCSTNFPAIQFTKGKLYECYSHIIMDDFGNKIPMDSIKNCKFKIFEFDNDDIDELIGRLNKKGYFCKVKPIWVNEDEKVVGYYATMWVTRGFMRNFGYGASTNKLNALKAAYNSALLDIIKETELYKSLTKTHYKNGQF